MMVIATQMDVISSSVGDPVAEAALMETLGVVRSAVKQVQNIA